MVYCWIGITECILISIYGYRHEKKFLFNPLTVFGIEWAVILFFSCMQLWTLVLSDDEVYIIILLGTTSYFVGYVISKKYLCRIQLKVNSFTNKCSHFVPRYYLLYVLSFFTIIYYAILTINILHQIPSFSLKNIIGIQRLDDFVGYDNRYLNALAVLVFRPISLAIPSITAVDFWFGKRDKILFVLNLALLIIKILSSGGRSIILSFGMYFLFCAIISLRRNLALSKKLGVKKKNKKTKRIIWIVVVAATILFVIMTTSRGTKLFQNVYIAFAIQPRMLEIWGDDVKNNGIIGYGLVSLFGFIYPLFYTFSNLFNFPMPSIIDNIFECINRTETEWVWPGTGMRNNAYVSLFWYFYADGRCLGIILGMFLFGCIVAKNCYQISTKKFNEKNMALYCLTLYAIIFSFVRLEYGDYSYALAIVYTYFIAYKKSRHLNQVGGY